MILDDDTRCGQLMPYRLYFLGADGRIARGLDLKCVDDTAAIQAVGLYADGHAMELWRGVERLFGVELNPAGRVTILAREPLAADDNQLQFTSFLTSLN